MAISINNLSARGECTEYRGLSTDTKPTSAKNGDTFYAMDTKKFYMYDEVGAQWYEM